VPISPKVPIERSPDCNCWRRNAVVMASRASVDRYSEERSQSAQLPISTMVRRDPRPAAPVQPPWARKGGEMERRGAHSRSGDLPPSGSPPGCGEWVSAFHRMPAQATQNSYWEGRRDRTECGPVVMVNAWPVSAGVQLGCSAPPFRPSWRRRRRSQGLRQAEFEQAVLIGVGDIDRSGPIERHTERQLHIRVGRTDCGELGQVCAVR
jgi:hypothetical protein